MDTLKKAAAEAAIATIENGAVVGVGTGSTVKFFIDALVKIKHRIDGAVASSIATAELLKIAGIPLLDLNAVGTVSIYVDGTDAVNAHLQLIKGGGGAFTREKIIAAAAKKFVCIADVHKWMETLKLDHLPLPMEVIPMARSYVAREIVKLGGTPVYRQGFVTDNGHHVLDVYQLPLIEPAKTESVLNNITGVVCHGLFAKRPADVLLLADASGVRIIQGTS